MIYAVIMFVLLLVFTMFVITHLIAKRNSFDQEKLPLPGIPQNTEVDV
jgi:hypothetical protein